jgi:hypothetical protein
MRLHSIYTAMLEHHLLWTTEDYARSAPPSAPLELGSMTPATPIIRTG